MTCYQACRSFETFIICLVFLSIQKVDVSAITVRSTSGELDGRGFSNFPGTFVSLFSVTNFSSVLHSVTIRLKIKSQTKFVLEGRSQMYKLPHIQREQLLPITSDHVI